MFQCGQADYTSTKRLCGSFIPAGKVLYWADKQAVREYFAQKVAVLDSVVHISPVAVLEDDGLTADFVKDAMQTVHILQKQLSAD